MKVRVSKNPTPRQTKLIDIVAENIQRRDGMTKNKFEMMVEAGYSPQMAHQPSRIFSAPAIQEGLESVLKALDKRRRQALQHLTEYKLMLAGPRELAYVTDMMTKNHQLLSGKNTQNGGLINADKVVVFLNQKDYGDRVARTTEAGSST